MFLTLFGQLAVCLAFVGAKPVPLSSFGDFATKHAWPAPPSNWVSSMPAPPDHLIRMKIGLKQANIDSLIDHLYEISDPTHARYGQHLSKEEVEELVRPHDETTETVKNWLESHGIDIETAVEKSPPGDWMYILIPVEKAEQMLDAKYHVFTHTPSSNSIVRTLSYSLPAALHDHIDVITPTTMFGSFHEMKKTSHFQPNVQASALKDDSTVLTLSGLAVPTSCNTAITPTCLQDLYGTTGYTPKSTAVNSIGIAGYLNEFASMTDLRTFASRFLPANAINATFSVVSIAGGLNTQSQPGGEANLDTQTAAGLTFPTPNTYYTTAGSPPFIADSNTPTDSNEPYDVFLSFILNQTSIPGVITTSYGDDEQTVPVDFATRVCNSFAQLGVRGTSVIFSSGDDGVGGGNCDTNDGTNKVQFQPAFPASCPFVTAVGATHQVNPEVAISFSGGGFSRVFARPSYQAAAVATFLTALGTTNAGLFNTTGRGYPDVAAQGSGFQIVISGTTRSIGGTSASAPTVAGVVTLLNDVRLAKGQPTLGFLNPLLYANPSTLTDITSGSNPGCGTNGFTARTGWDPISGLGTPNFIAMQAL